MGFFDPKNVWGTGIEGVMGFPLLTNSGSTQNLWGMRDYGFRGLWDKRASTVHGVFVGRELPESNEFLKNDNMAGLQLSLG